MRVMTMHFRPEIRALMLALAGAVVLAIGMGYGRFSYTGILPVMLQEGLLSLHQGNLAASANYAGYLIGALLLAKAKPADARRLNMASVGLTIGCLLLLAWTKSPWAVVAVRGFAGLLSAVSLIAASLWLLQHMKHHTGAPVLYAGVGLGIFLSAEFIALGKTYGYTSQQIWLLCGLTALLLFALVFKLLLSPPDYLIDYQKQASSQAQPKAGGAKAAWKLLVIYGLAGFGYIITATYLPLFLSGSLSTLDPVQLWAIFGLAAIPSCFVWHQIVSKYGYRRAFAANLLVQATGVVLPAFSHSLLFCLLSAVLVGFTFTGTVTIALPEARRLAHLVRFNMIAAMTAIYGIGQIIGPLVAGELYGITGSFNGSLAAATGALLLAGGLVLTGRSEVAG